MGIEDEISEFAFKIRLHQVEGKLGEDIRTPIGKARTAPSLPQARWYLAWAKQLDQKAREKEDKEWADSVEASVKRVGEFSFVNQNLSS